MQRVVGLAPAVAGLAVSAALLIALAPRAGALVFVCADGELNTAAAAEGLAVVDPNDTGQEDQSDV